MTQEPRLTPDMTPERMEQISEKHREIDGWSETPELLPCPFCGGNSVLNCDSYMSCAWVDCQACESEGKTICVEDTNDANQMRAEAVAAWNKRTARTLTPEQMERARSLLKADSAEWTEDTWDDAAYELLREVVGE